MAVVIETTLGDITVDLFIEERPQTCKNFLKLCKVKYYNFSLFHSVQSNFLAQTGDPTGTGNGGESIFGLVMGSKARYYEGEKTPKIRHNRPGLLSMVNCGNSMLGSQFFITLGANLSSLDDHCVFAEVTEGQEVLLKLNETICDTLYRPYQDVRITHTVILEDPFEDLEGMVFPDVSPDRSQMIESGRIAADEPVVEKEKSETELAELRAEQEAKARATILEIVGDLPEADTAPPENVLFVCKLNPVTTDEDLELIFRRFGNVKSCEVIRDKITGDSLQYAFIEFEVKEACERAYEKMENTLIDDRRIHVDFSQSVAKLRWRGKGRGVEHINPNGGSPKNVRGRGNNEQVMRSVGSTDNGRRVDDRRNNDHRFNSNRNDSRSFDSSRRNESRRSRSREKSGDKKHNERIKRSSDRKREIRNNDGNRYEQRDSKGVERNHGDDSKIRDKDYERKYERERGKDRETGKEREKDRDREKDEDRGKDRGRDRDRDKERVRGRDRDVERYRYRDIESRMNNRSNERALYDGRREECKREESGDRSRDEDKSRKREESSSHYSSETKSRREERSETRMSSSSKNDVLDKKKMEHRNSDSSSVKPGSRDRHSKDVLLASRAKYGNLMKEDKEAHSRSQSDFSLEKRDKKSLKTHQLSEERLALKLPVIDNDNERIVVIEKNHVSSPYSNNSQSSSSKLNAIDRVEKKSKKSKRHCSSSSASSSSDSSSSNSDSNSSSSSSVDMTVAKKYYNHKGKLVRKVITKKQKNKDSKRRSRRKNDKIVVIKKIKKKQSSSDVDSESSSDESSDDRHKRHRKSKSAKKKIKRKHSDSESDSSESNSSSKRKKKKSKKRTKQDSSSD